MDPQRGLTHRLKSDIYWYMAHSFPSKLLTRGRRSFCTKQQPAEQALLQVPPSSPSASCCSVRWLGRYFKFYWKSQAAMSDELVYALLTKPLRDRLRDEMLENTLDKLPVFKALDSHAVSKVLTISRPIRYLRWRATPARRCQTTLCVVCCEMRCTCFHGAIHRIRCCRQSIASKSVASMTGCAPRGPFRCTVTFDVSVCLYIVSSLEAGNLLIGGGSIGAEIFVLMEGQVRADAENAPHAKRSAALVMGICSSALEM